LLPWPSPAWFRRARRAPIRPPRRRRRHRPSPRRPQPGARAVVTLKVLGKGRVQHIVADDSPDEDDELVEPEDDGDAGDFTLGSAVIIDAAGIAVTTARLGRASLGLQGVTSDGRRLTTKLIGRDEETDVAVLSLCCDAGLFPVIALGNSDRVRPGDWVVAVGAPFGLGASATASVVAEVARADADGVDGVIQTSGSVTAGYAGGPLVDTAGAMMGLVVGSSAGSGASHPRRRDGEGSQHRGAAAAAARRAVVTRRRV
jgi:S1-C subfamily serine protease